MEKNKKKGWKKALHIVKITVVSLIALVALVLAGSFTAHKLSLASEGKRIKAYGQKMPVFDSQMNVKIDGQGKQTIVLLTGFGTAAPALDFTPMIEELKKDYQVVTIEPFGYGLSGQTERARTSDNMVAEIQSVVEQLNLETYILMGHSISGIYSLNYANTYPDEVKAFVGIDSSTSHQAWPGVDDSLIKFASNSGLLRLVTKVSPPDSSYLDQETAEQMRMLTMKNSGNETVSRELSELGNSFELANSQRFPKTTPVLLFVAISEETRPDWVKLHEDTVAGLDHGKVIELPGDHYLHHTQAPKMAEELNHFFNNQWKSWE